MLNKVQQERCVFRQDICCVFSVVSAPRHLFNVSADKTSSFYVRHLGGWVNAQRRARKRGELPDHMVRSLDAIGFPWKIRRLSGENSLKQDSLHHDNVVLPPSIFQVTFDAEQM